MINTLFELFDKIDEEITKGNKLKDLENIVKEYCGNDWKEYCKFCNKKYKRNRVKINENIEMLILCWSKGQCSGIHDHPNNGCILKILKGNIKEEVYDSETMKCIKVNESYENDISYQEGKNGLHNIINNGDSCVVSLHIYSPPNYMPKFY